MFLIQSSSVKRNALILILIAVQDWCTEAAKSACFKSLLPKEFRAVVSSRASLTFPASTVNVQWVVSIKTHENELFQCYQFKQIVFVY